MADGSFPTTQVKVEPAQLLPVLDAYRRKYEQDGHPPLIAARNMMTTALHIFAKHAGAAEAAAVCAETIAQVRSTERLSRMDG